MSKRPTVSDLARAAGVSVATVDRVLNQRHPVREGTADRVLRAAEAIGFHATSLLKQRLRAEAPRRTLGFLLQKRDAFYQQLADDLQAATRDLTSFRGKADRRIRQRTVAGDDRRASAPSWRAGRRGRRRLGRPSLCVAGDRSLARARRADLRHAFRSDRRSPRRLHRARQSQGGAHRRLDDRQDRQAARQGRHHRRQPSLSLPGDGGNIVSRLFPRTCLGLSRPRAAHQSRGRAHRPCRDAEHDRRPIPISSASISAAAAWKASSPPRAKRRRTIAVAIVCNELTPKTRAGLIEGVLTAVIATPTAQLATRTLEAMARAIESASRRPAAQILVPFDLYVSTNI